MEFKRKKIEGRLYKIMKLTKTKLAFIKKKIELQNAPKVRRDSHKKRKN